MAWLISGVGRRCLNQWMQHHKKESSTLDVSFMGKEIHEYTVSCAVMCSFIPYIEMQGKEVQKPPVEQ